MDLIEGGMGIVQGALRSILPEGALADLAADGIVGGVGNVLVFIPQIAILFLFIAILEDSGYLARAAFISDRLMARIGLHGRAFVPLLSGFACAVPAIMATRTIESRRDRLVTIMVAPLVSCSARLPVYALIIAALFASDRTVLGVFSLGGILLLAMYLLSVAMTVLAAFVLKRTVLKSPTPPLVLELPPYRMPDARSVLRRAYDRCKVFVRDAGTVILACSIVLWALLYFPRDVKTSFDPNWEKKLITDSFNASFGGGRRAEPKHVQEMVERRNRAFENIDKRYEAERLQLSFAGRIGHAIEPVIRPLGFDWKIGIGLLASFAAREVFVSTMGLVYGVGEADEESSSLREAIRAQKGYTPLVGLSLMVFFLLACQCMSTVAVVRRETNSWRWPLFMFGYMTVLAYLGSLLVYQGGRLLGFS
jgi:ferrous iron transport protein B